MTFRQTNTTHCFYRRWMICKRCQQSLNEWQHLKKKKEKGSIQCITQNKFEKKKSCLNVFSCPLAQICFGVFSTTDFGLLDLGCQIFSEKTATGCQKQVMSRSVVIVAMCITIIKAGEIIQCAQSQFLLWAIWAGARAHTVKRCTVHQREKKKISCVFSCTYWLYLS